MLRRDLIDDLGLSVVLLEGTVAAGMGRVGGLQRRRIGMDLLNNDMLLDDGLALGFRRFRLHGDRLIAALFTAAMTTNSNQDNQGDKDQASDDDAGDRSSTPLVVAISIPHDVTAVVEGELIEGSVGAVAAVAVVLSTGDVEGPLAETRAIISIANTHLGVLAEAAAVIFIAHAPIDIIAEAVTII